VPRGRWSHLLGPGLDGQECEVRIDDGRVVRGRGETAAGVGGHERVEPGLVDVCLARIEPVDDPLVDVDGDDVVAEVGETRGDRGADVAAADDACVHAQVVAWRGDSRIGFRGSPMGSATRDGNVLDTSGSIDGHDPLGMTGTRSRLDPPAACRRSDRGYRRREAATAVAPGRSALGDAGPTTGLHHERGRL